MKKILVFAFLIILILLVGCSNKNDINQQPTKTKANQLGKTGNPSVKLDCNILSNNEIISAGSIDKIQDDSGSEPYIVSYSCQRVWYVVPIGKHVAVSLALRVTDYTNQNIKSSVDSTCSDKPSLGIGDASCVIYQGNIIFKRGNYDIELSSSSIQDNVIEIAKVINNKI
ncbi:hypothetical protein HYU23_01115 [Candidatus Woesearchaeota archaeon]|nr:hypothetical protein [Candidatus Woesearchaeota archaeon]